VPDHRITSALDRVERCELTPPDRTALVGLLASSARAVDTGATLPSYLHMAAEQALTVLAGDR
jgi:hypothetical protein